MHAGPDIDLILPCYNPVPGWEQVVVERLAVLRSSFPQHRIRGIVVNDGSEYQKTAAGVEKLEASGNDILLITYPNNMGKGFAIRTGVQRSVASVIAYTDIDLPYTTESMINVIRPVLDREADVCLAIRNATYYEQLPTMRRWMSKFLRTANSLVLRLHTSDTQGGLKAFSHDLRETFLQTRINRYLFDLEFVYHISRLTALRIRAVEADLREGIVMSPVRMHILLRESLNFLKVLAKRGR